MITEDNPERAANLTEVPRSWERRHHVLLEEMKACIRGVGAAEINLSSVPHFISAWALHSLTYDRSFGGAKLPIVYQDNSRPRPIELGCFAEDTLPETESLPNLRLGLMSFRHPEMDFFVDLYVNRNIGISGGASMAEEDRCSAENTVRLLSEPSLADGAMVHAFHTGLEPMVVGFYRGVIQVLREREQAGLPRRLIICPKVYIGQPVEGTLSRNSPGAVPTNYVDLPAWF